MEGNVGKDDEILEKREEGVDSGFTEGIVAPVAVHGWDEREQVPGGDENFATDQSLLEGIFWLVNRQPTYKDV